MKDKILAEAIDAQGLITRAYLLLSQKKYDHAIRIFSNLLAQFPDDPEIMIGLASSYQYKGDTKQAIQTAEHVLQIDPSYAYAYTILAEIYFFNKNDYNTAEKFVFKSIEINPFESSSYSLLAQICYYNNKYEESYYYAHEALELDPLNYVAHMVLGLYYLHIPNFNKAEEHYKACLSLAPNNAAVYCNYGMLQLSFAQNEMGYRLLREAVKLNPQDPFLQETFREAFIRNNFFYSPLNKLTNGLVDDSYILYANILILVLLPYFFKVEILSDFIRLIFFLFWILNVLILFTVLGYRFAIRIIINWYYSNAIDKGTLAAIIK